MAASWALSTPTYDPLGFVEIKTIAGQEPGELTRRLTRSATLDGGAVVSDFGFSDGDRTIDVRWSPVSAADEANIGRLFESYAQVQIATPDGVFLAAPESYRRGAAESSLRLLVIEKLSE